MINDRRKKGIKEYQKKMQDPRWIAKREEIIERDGKKCKNCGRDYKKVTLQVHHIEYKYGVDPWNYPNENLITLCVECHFEETVDEELFKYMLYSGGLGSLSKKHRKLIRQGIINAFKKGDRLT
jgi:5-methylcytosine-specific restriction endonuclease McrA